MDRSKSSGPREAQAVSRRLDSVLAVEDESSYLCSMHTALNVMHGARGMKYPNRSHHRAFLNHLSILPRPLTK